MFRFWNLWMVCVYRLLLIKVIEGHLAMQRPYIFVFDLTFLNFPVPNCPYSTENIPHNLSPLKTHQVINTPAKTFHN